MILMDDGTMPQLERHGTKDYAEYLKHQASNTEIPQYILDYYTNRYYLELGIRIQEFGAVRPGMTVLCLAAGTTGGAEVKAFIKCGCFAVGIDLNPGEKSKYVLYGDFHQLQFGQNTVDVVFTNALDHVFNLGILIGEICRVLKPGGFLITDVTKGRAECNGQPDQFLALWWQTIDDILAPFLLGGFELVSRTDFEWPWPGQHVILRWKPTHDLHPDPGK